MYSDSSKVTFIPKAPVTSIQVPTSISGVAAPDPNAALHKGLGFVGGLTLILLIVTGLVSAGSIMYLRVFQTEQSSIVEGIKKKQQLVDTNFIASLQKLSTRISYTKQLLANQVYISPFFDALHTATLPDIQFDTFSFTEKKDTAAASGPNTPQPAGASAKSYQAVLVGHAKSFETIAQQSDVFALNPILKTHYFHDFTIEKEKNLIGFSLTVDLPASLGHDQFMPGGSADSAITQQGSDQTVPPQTANGAPVTTPGSGSTQPVNSLPSPGTTQ